MNSKTKELTLNALFIAITVVMAVIPNLGMIHLGAVSITIMHIPVIIAGIILGMRSAVINSLAFGLSSMFISATRPTMPLEVFFVNPLVSVIPRLLFGISVALIYKLLLKTKLSFALRTAITAALSTLLHTIFVLTPLYFLIVRSNDIQLINSLPGSIFTFLWITLVSNGVLEIIASILISMPITSALKKVQVEA